MMANMPTSQILACTKHAMRMSKMSLVRYPLGYYQVKLAYKLITYLRSLTFSIGSLSLSHTHIHSLENCSPKGNLCQLKDLDV